MEVESFKSYLKNAVESCSADLLHKAAHSGGDAQNLLSIPEKGRVLRLYKLRRDGKTEIVDVLYPGEGEKDTSHIKNSEFGEWIKQRNKNCKNQQLLYVNGSCNSSDQKAPNEVIAIKSSNFVNIPSTTINYLWPSYPKAGSLKILKGISQGKTYKQIHSDIERSTLPHWEGFIFPGQKKYDEIIGKAVRNYYEYEFID